MSTKHKKSGLPGVLFGLTVGTLGALAAVFLGNKENRAKTVTSLKTLKSKGRKMLK